MENTTGIEFDETLDAKGLNCPLPVLKAKVALNKIQPGRVLYVESTDPHSKIDFEAYCARAGHEIIGIEQAGDTVGFYIRRAKTPRNI